MNKLIKSEIYRLTRSGIYFPLYVIITALIFPVSMLFPDELPMKNMMGYITYFAQTSGGMVLTYSMLFVAGMLGNMYSNRTYYYEIMDGQSTHKIIFSKLIVYNAMELGLFLVPACAVFAGIGMNLGFGDTKQLWLTVILGIFILLNITTTAVLITMLIRNLIGGVILNFTLFGFISMFYMVFVDIFPSKAIEKIFSVFPLIQLTSLVQTEYTTKYIVTVIASFAVTFILLYSLTYLSYKRKNFR
ncbi:MAG: hypothetical protein ACI4JW_07565 [Oscillospiraceae bacterium]